MIFLRGVNGQEGSFEGRTSLNDPEWTVEISNVGVKPLALSGQLGRIVSHLLHIFLIRASRLRLFLLR